MMANKSAEIWIYIDVESMDGVRGLQEILCSIIP